MNCNCLKHGTGRLAEFLQSLDLFDSSTFPGGRCIRECLEQICMAPRSLVVHGNYLNDDDVSWLRGHPECSVVYCPRTHSYFGHDRYPLETPLIRRCSHHPRHRQPSFQPGSRFMEGSSARRDESSGTPDRSSHRHATSNAAACAGDSQIIPLRSIREFRAFRDDWKLRRSAGVADVLRFSDV